MVSFQELWEIEVQVIESHLFVYVYLTVSFRLKTSGLDLFVLLYIPDIGPGSLSCYILGLSYIWFTIVAEVGRTLDLDSPG